MRNIKNITFWHVLITLTVLLFVVGLGADIYFQYMESAPATPQPPDHVCGFVTYDIPVTCVDGTATLTFNDGYTIVSKFDISTSPPDSWGYSKIVIQWDIKQMKGNLLYNLDRCESGGQQLYTDHWTFYRSGTSTFNMYCHLGGSRNKFNVIVTLPVTP